MQRNVLFFKDLSLSISEWIPFGQNSISTLNFILASVKGVRDSLLTGKVDEAPDTPKFSMRPFFTRVILEDFDRYDWIKFSAHIEYEEAVEQIRRVGVHVDKSGFINYSLRLDKVFDRESEFPLDAVSAVLADVVEDTSIMMEALLTQFQRRCLTLVHGSETTAQRSKYIVAVSSGLVPEEEIAMKYQDGKDRQNEIDQVLGTSYEFQDLPGGEMLILGTYGLIYVTRNPQDVPNVLTLYSAVRSLQMFQTIFFARLRQIWDMIKDLRLLVTGTTSQEELGELEQQMSQLSADIVLIDEINEYMRAAVEMMAEIWDRNRTGPTATNVNMVKALEIDRELEATKGTIKDMVMISKGLVDEIQGIRDLLGTMAEKRMRDLNRLMTDNVQQGSEAQQIMLANVKESRYSSAALKILSALSAGYLGMKISDILMKVLDNEGYSPPFSDTYSGSFFHLAFGLTFWLILAIAFFNLIKKGTARVKRQKMAKQFNLNIRFPVDEQVPRKAIEEYLARRDLIFYNVEVTGHRMGWHHRETRGDHKVLWVVSLCYDPNTGNLNYIHVNTEDSKGDANYTTDAILGDMVTGGVLTRAQEARIRDRMGTMMTGGVPG
jgi:hypothetical protein